MRYLAVIALLAVAACTGRSAHPPMSTQEIRQERIAKECRYEAAKVSGYDWVDATLRRQEVYKTCMEMKGHEL